MISCYLLHLEAMLAQPPGDPVDVILRNAEARRILLRSQELVELRRLRIMLLRYQLIERRLLRRFRLQQKDHMLHREARIHRRFTHGACQCRVHIAWQTNHVALGDISP